LTKILTISKLPWSAAVQSGDVPCSSTQFCGDHVGPQVEWKTQRHLPKNQTSQWTIPHWLLMFPGGNYRRAPKLDPCWCFPLALFADICFVLSVTYQTGEFAVAGFELQPQ
jgi:hypothetical protein